MEETYPKEVYFKKKVAGLDKISKPDELFLTSRKLLTQFVNVFNQESFTKEKETKEHVEECLKTMLKLKEGFENIEDNKRKLADVFDAIDVLFDIGRYATNLSCSDNAFRCIMGIIARINREGLKIINKAFLVKLETLSDFYKQSVSGRVMMVFIELLMKYIGSFPTISKEKIAYDVQQALNKDGDQTLIDLAEWNKTRSVEFARCIANRLPAANFYLLPTSNGTIDETILQPAVGSESFITEWNIHTQCLTTECRVNGSDEMQAVRILFSDIVKYSFFREDDSPHVQLELTQNVVKLYTDLAYILELQHFLKQTLGGKETKTLTPLDEIINHIIIDESYEESIVDNLPEPPRPITAVPERLLNLEQSSNVVSSGRLDTTGSIAGEPEDGASSPCPSATTEVVGTDDQRGQSTFKAYPRRRGNMRSQNIPRENNGCNRPGQDPYDLKDIANESDSSEGKTQGRKKRVSQKSKPKSPLPSLVKRNCSNRASSSNKKPCDSTNVAKDDEDEAIAEDSDDSWQPGPKKPPRLNASRQPTKRTKRSPQL